MSFSSFEIVKMALLSSMGISTPIVILTAFNWPFYWIISWLLLIVWIVGRFVYTTFLGDWAGWGTDVSKYGPWAVVTGSTDGIGKEFAKQLAAKGLNIVLVSRSPLKLQDTKLEIEKLQPSIKVKTVAVDFTKDRAIYQQMAAELRDLEIGVLVNNVGMCENFCEPFSDIQSDQIIDDMVACNVVSVPRMIHMILPGMLQRKRGIIINIGSMAGAIKIPLGTLYGATKAFVNKFSEDLEYELRGTGVMVQTVVPGYVLTNMVKGYTRLQSFFGVPNAKEYVAATLRTLGLESRTAGYWFHKIQIPIHVLSDYLAPEVGKFGVSRFLRIIVGQKKE